MVTKNTLLSLQSHPFKTGVRGILLQHFSSAIVDRFSLRFEAETFDVVQTHNQRKDGNLIMEVGYNHPSGVYTYICDIFSWMTKAQTEVKLLRYIEDKCISGELGKDWVERKGQISEAVKSGKHQTIDPLG